jgi:glycosyltransferase involved in cell wall biosynthesis
MQSPTRILFVTSGATRGGAERQLLNFLRHCDKSLINPSVLTVLAADSALRRGGSDFRDELAEIQVPCRSLDLARFPSIPGILALFRAIRLERPNILQTYGLAVDLTVRMMAPLVGRPRLVGSLRGPEEQRSSLLFRLDGWTSVILDGYISNSRAGAAALVRRAGVQSARIVIIPNGLDLDSLARSRSLDARFRLRAEWGVPPQNLVAVTVGNIHAAKGHEDLVRAARLCTRGDVTFVLAGEDRSGKRIPELVQRLNLSDRFRFLGLRRDIADVLLAADIFIMPSHWEGMSNALMEAMASGLPCIATDVGAAAELLDEGRAGVLVPARDPENLARVLSRLLAMPADRQRLGAAAAQRVRQHYTLERMVTLHESYYSRLDKMPRRRFARLGSGGMSGRQTKVG